MGLQQARGHADRGHKSQSSLDHFDVISPVADRLEFYHDLWMPRFKPFPAVNAKQKVPEGSNVESSCFHRCFSIVSDSPREPGGG
jgi:hypothetical protein